MSGCHPVPPLPPEVRRAFDEAEIGPALDELGEQQRRERIAARIVELQRQLELSTVLPALSS
jgi:hypothetical protein